MEKAERLILFSRELYMIKNPKLRVLAEEALIKCDDYFFSMPASTSGKYHPDYSLGDGGLVRHTKAVMYFTNEIMRSELFGREEIRDLLLVAALLHDIKKKGDGSGAHTVKEHPQYAAEFLMTLEGVKNISTNDVDIIKNAILSHMGIWGEPKPETTYEKILHIADLMASRKNVFVDYLVEEKNTGQVSEPKPMTENITDDSRIYTGDPADFKYPFGKHIGKPLKEIPEDYLLWVVKNVDNKPELIEIVSKYLNNK